MKTKICTKCHKEKDLSKFNKHLWCKECIDQYNKEYADKNKEKISKQKKQYYIDHKEILKQKSKKHRENNPEYHKKYQKIYNQNSIYKVKRNKLRKIRYDTDISFKIKVVLRARIVSILKGNIKSLNTMFLIGCEIDYLMYHIQNKFTEGMLWDNYGLWHIDHKLPCASFDLSDPEEQRKCFHYSNLQPLWAKENLKKGSKILHGFKS